MEPRYAGRYDRAAVLKVFAGNVVFRAVCKYISYWNHLEIRTYRGVDTFTNNFNPANTTYNISIPLNIQQDTGISKDPVTLGDHLRRRRLELGLYQKDVAIQIGVTTSCIWNWEHGWSITFRCMPKVIEFLGYNPIPCPDDIVERLTWYKQINGLTLEDLGAEMRRDPEQLGDWLNGRHAPCRKNREEIWLFLADDNHKPC